MALSQPHQIFSGSLQESLTPVEITIHIEVDLLGESPKADILLLRREGEAWNEAQRARLPDGVRDNAAGHVLVEFKYTESVNPKALAQAIAYDYFYRQGQKLREEQVQTVVLSARTPRRERLEMWGYEELQKGVFLGPPPVLDRVWLLALNDLPAKPHNAFVKLFASQRKEREAAFAALDAPTLAESPSLLAYVFGLRQTLGVEGESEMAEKLTPEKVMEIGEQVRRRALELASPEERLKGIEPSEISSELLQLILEKASPEERLVGLTNAERRALLRLLQEEMGTDSSAAENGESETN
jgi:hypothetical protein